MGTGTSAVLTAQVRRDNCLLQHCSVLQIENARRSGVLVCTNQACSAIPNQVSQTDGQKIQQAVLEKSLPQKMFILLDFEWICQKVDSYTIKKCLSIIFHNYCIL